MIHRGSGRAGDLPSALNTSPRVLGVGRKRCVSPSHYPDLRRVNLWMILYRG